MSKEQLEKLLSAIEQDGAKERLIVKVTSKGPAVELDSAAKTILATGKLLKSIAKQQGHDIVILLSEAAIIDGKAAFTLSPCLKSQWKEICKESKP
ncbi:MAG: hypothetical protein E6Q97_19210 [Desulfurellales bacterium]|nr:MAG: hypothetical protein E6Q97_19210 [Desulfurellales bacterium]